MTETSEFFTPKDAEILVVEDSPTQAMKLQHVLERHQYRVVVTRNGREALAAIAARRPTLVITDINMPEMDGYELCKRIKDDAQWRELPVILLTSLADPKDILRGLECGADNFIVKPYDAEFLQSRIQYVLANLDLRQRSKGTGATEIFFAGHKYQLTSERIHSIDLLLSTYETAVQKNLELSKAKETLELQAEQLREKNEEMHADLEMARELQTAFLPRHYPVFPAHCSPDQSAIQFCHRYFTTSELGGDFFDILALSDTTVGVLMCDVMGHGVRAALVTAIVRGLVEELKPVAADPGKFLKALNEGLCAILSQTLTPLFTSAFYLVADVERGEMHFANAGHPAPFHVRRTAGVVQLLEGDFKPGPALGVFGEATYTGGSCKIEPNDLVMLFTDGLFEVEGRNGEFFDKEQLLAVVASQMSSNTPQLFDGVLDAVQKFAGTEKFEDDLCIVGMDIVRVSR